MPTQANIVNHSTALFSSLVVEPEELEAQLAAQELIVIDLSSAQSYQQHHIPGAINLDYAHLIRGTPPAPGLLPKPDRLQALINALGITSSKTIIACDDQGGGKSARLIWMLDCIGHHNKALLNGGIHSWINEGHTLETALNLPVPLQHPVQNPIIIDRKPIADIEYLLGILESDEHVLLDARSPEEYAGLRGGGLRKGHIPGAVNMDWIEAIDQTHHSRFMPKAVMIEKLENLGITPDKQVVTYCYTHHRSAHTYVLLKHLGFEQVKGYDGSWSEWGNHPELPIE